MILYVIWHSVYLYRSPVCDRSSNVLCIFSWALVCDRSYMTYSASVPLPYPVWQVTGYLTYRQFVSNSPVVASLKLMPRHCALCIPWGRTTTTTFLYNYETTTVIIIMAKLILSTNITVKQIEFGEKSTVTQSRGCPAMWWFQKKNHGFRQENVEGDCGSWFSEEELGRTSILSVHSLFP